MAPFWDDINLNSGGEISYETFESGFYLDQVNTFIRRERSISFTGTWMMNVYYQQVAPYGGIFGGGGSGEVSVSIRMLDTLISYALRKFFHFCRTPSKQY